MKPIIVTRHINAPVERVYELFTDLEHAAEHIDGLERVEMLSDSPFGVGTRWRETRVIFGHKATEVMEITACDPLKKYVAEASSHGSHYRSVWKFAAIGAGTDVSMEFTATPLSLIAQLMTPLSGMMMKSVAKLMERDMTDLANLAESED